MRTVTLLSLILIGAMPCLLSCQDAGRDPAPAAPWSAAAKSLDDQQDYLDDLWQRGQEMDFEVVLTAVFKPEDGCNVSAVPPSWADDFPEYLFNLSILPDALPEADFGEITITISVPTLASIDPAFDQAQAMPIERTIQYEETGPEYFDPAAVLTIAFHPHLRPSCRDYCFFGIEQDEQDPGFYYVNDPQDVLPPAQNHEKRLAPPPLNPIENPIISCATGIQLEITSFTPVERPDRWHVVNGCCGRGGRPIETPCDWD